MLSFSTSERFDIFLYGVGTPWNFSSSLFLKPQTKNLRGNALKAKGPWDSRRGEEDIYSLYKAEISTMGDYILSHCRFCVADALLAIFAAVTLPNRLVNACQLEKALAETYVN
jgi:hypothetical protein